MTQNKKNTYVAPQPTQRHRRRGVEHATLAQCHSRGSVRRAHVSAIGQQRDEDPGAVILVPQPHHRVQPDQQDADERARAVHLREAPV